MGAVCGADLDCSVRSHCGGPKPVYPARDRTLALEPRPPCLCVNAGRPRAGHWRLTISRVGFVTLPARQQPHCFSVIIAALGCAKNGDALINLFASADRTLIG